MKRVTLMGCFAIVMFLMMPLSSSASEFYQCDRWSTFSNGGFNVYNNIWGYDPESDEADYSQCLWADAFNNWGVRSNLPHDIPNKDQKGGVKAYPNVSKELSIYVDDLASCTSSFSVTRPSSGAYCSAYDIWYDNHAYEVMLWMNKTGAVGPLGTYQTNQTIGGHNWDIYKGSNGWNQVFSFVRTSNTDSGTVDIKAISDWIRTKGWFGNANLHKIEFGFEITSSAGGKDFSCTSYSLSYKEGGSSGGGNTGGGGCNSGSTPIGCGN